MYDEQEGREGREARGRDTNKFSSLRPLVVRSPPAQFPPEKGKETFSSIHQPIHSFVFPLLPPHIAQISLSTTARRQFVRKSDGARIDQFSAAQLLIGEGRGMESVLLVEISIKTWHYLTQNTRICLANNLFCNISFFNFNFKTRIKMTLYLFDLHKYIFLRRNGSTRPRANTLSKLYKNKGIEKIEPVIWRPLYV